MLACTTFATPNVAAPTATATSTLPLRPNRYRSRCLTYPSLHSGSAATGGGAGRGACTLGTSFLTDLGPARTQACPAAPQRATQSGARSSDPSPSPDGPCCRPAAAHRQELAGHERTDLRAQALPRGGAVVDGAA